VPVPGPYGSVTGPVAMPFADCSDRIPTPAADAGMAATASTTVANAAVADSRTAPSTVLDNLTSLPLELGG
jgi:hypothetical protein